MSWQNNIDVMPLSGALPPKRPPAYEAIVGRWQQSEIESVRQEIPITGRRGEALSLLYGYQDLKDFWEDLPTGAEILDVGSGGSTFGLEVCQGRPDIRWLNADTCYKDDEIRKKLLGERPPNLDFVAADVMNLTETVGEQQFDRVFSYFLLSHIRLAGQKAGLLAAEQLLRVAKPGGRIAVGPVMTNRTGLAKRKKPGADAVMLEAPKDEQELCDLATQLVRTIQPNFLSSLVQSRINRSSRKIPR